MAEIITEEPLEFGNKITSIIKLGKTPRKGKPKRHHKDSSYKCFLRDKIGQFLMTTKNSTTVVFVPFKNGSAIATLKSENLKIANSAKRDSYTKGPTFCGQ